MILTPICSLRCSFIFRLTCGVSFCGPRPGTGKCSTTGLLLYELGGLTERELEQLRAAGPVRANLRTVLHERGEDANQPPVLLLRRTLVGSLDLNFLGHQGGFD